MFKKVIALVLAMLMLAGLAACGTGAPKKEFTLGTITGNKYENSFIGIACNLPSDWSMLTQEEVKAQNEQALGMMGEEYANAIANATIIYEMFATHENMTDTVNVNMEKLTGAAAALNEEAYAKLSIESLKSALESMGLTVTSATVGTVSFAGKDRTCINIEGEFMGIPVYEVVVCMKCGNYMAVISTCTWSANTCDQILANFYAV